MRKRTRVLALVLSLSLILPGMAQGVPSVVKAAAEDSFPSNPSKNEDGIMTWDSIYFGKYWQRDTNGDGKVNQSDEKEPIKWRVLSVRGNDAFLLADQPLDCRKYSGDQNDVSLDENYEEGLSATWEDCSLRTWLNETFYQDAFSEEEGAAVQTVTVTNEDSLVSGIEGGNDTQDKVYLLSLTEVILSRYGFSPSIGASVERAAAGTKYAENNDAMDFDLDSYWWLRTPGASQTSAVVISPSGQIGTNGMPVDFAPLGVRPVLHLDLSTSSVWESAGTVTGTQPATPTEEPKPTDTVTTPPVATNLPNTTEEPKPTATATAAQTQTPDKEPGGSTQTETPKQTKKPEPTTTMQPGEKKAISSFEDLQAMEDIPSGDYYLTNDITVPVNAQLFRDYPFTGTLDGNGYKIEGYQVQKKCVFPEAVTREIRDNEADELLSEKPDGGLFCWVYGATFRNLSMTNVNIDVQTEAYAAVGALVADGDGEFSNIHVSGKISVQSLREDPLGWGANVGGITARGGTMTNCSNSASITVNYKGCSNGDYAASVGGLAGGHVYKLTKCSNSGNISLSGYCGWNSSMGVAGLVSATAESITSCTNSGNVSLNVQAGQGQTVYENLVTDGMNYFTDKINVLDTKVAGIAMETDNIKSSGNTGKISMYQQFAAEDAPMLAGLVCQVDVKAQRCYNKGTVSFSGKTANGSDNCLRVGGLFSICRYKKNQLSECYNTGKVTVKPTNKGFCFVGGIVGMESVENGKIQNCYNAGNLSVKTPGRGVVGGIVGEQYCVNPPRGWMRYNYNVGKITGSKQVKKGTIQGGFNPAATEYLVKPLTYDNYYKGSGKIYGYTDGKKKYAPKAKKVSSITRAKCPRLSSKYWVYSSKVKRLILKNNKETKLGIKTTKKTTKKTKKKTTKKSKKKATKKTTKKKTTKTKKKKNTKKTKKK